MVANLALLGVRALREDYLKPAARGDLARNLRAIEERFCRSPSQLGAIMVEERNEYPRFHHYFAGGEKFPQQVFLAALELQPSETLNGQVFPFDSDVMLLRDHLVMTYKPLVQKCRLVFSKELDDLPMSLVGNLAAAWHAFESVWLRNKEQHAVQALQPLAKAILSLEPLLLSLRKERLLPWPRVQHQKAVTVKTLEGFMNSLADLAAAVLPTFSREMHHDPKLLLLMDHVLSLRGERNITSCLDGASATPEVSFPDHQVQGVEMQDPLVVSQQRGISLDAYAFRLLGASVGDAVAAGKLKVTDGNGQAGRAKLAMTGSVVETASLRGRGINHETAAGGTKETNISKRSAVHAEELLCAFEAIKDTLLSLKSTLEHVDAALDRDEAFVDLLKRFERAYHRSKRLFLEPDNLA